MNSAEIHQSEGKARFLRHCAGRNARVSYHSKPTGQPSGRFPELSRPRDSFRNAQSSNFQQNVTCFRQDGNSHGEAEPFRCIML